MRGCSGAPRPLRTRRIGAHLTSLFPEPDDDAPIPGLEDAPADADSFDWLIDAGAEPEEEPPLPSSRPRMLTGLLSRFAQPEPEPEPPRDEPPSTPAEPEAALAEDDGTWTSKRRRCLTSAWSGSNEEDAGSRSSRRRFNSL
jgi:hypothetical protein